MSFQENNSKNNWEPPESLEEWIRGALIPPRLYYVIRALRERALGEAELKLLPFLVDPTRYAVDVGANKGVYTYWLERFSKHVYAYEPNPKIFNILRRGVGLNATVKNAALSDTTGEAELRIPMTSNNRYSNQGASLNHLKIGDKYGNVMVDVRSLDDENLKNIGFLKVDVEGHEMEVLDGAKETIERDKPVMLIEMEEKHTSRPIAEDVSRVEKLGYRMVFLHRGVLKMGDQFDVHFHHTDPGADYVFNFMFLPIKAR